MASWRDNASQHAQDDLDGLLGLSLSFAQRQLERRGEFYPYAVVIDADGQQRIVAADTGHCQPTSADLITTLIATLSEQRDHLRAVAIVADIRVPESVSDAIRVTLEHSERIALTVLLTYTTRRIGQGIAYRELQADTAAACIWPTD